MRRLRSTRASPSTRRIRRHRPATTPPEVLEVLDVLGEQEKTSPLPWDAAGCSRSPASQIQSVADRGLVRHDHPDDRDRARRARPARRSHPAVGLSLDLHARRHLLHAHSVPGRALRRRLMRTSRPSVSGTAEPAGRYRRAGGNWDRPRQCRSWGSPAHSRRVEGLRRASRGGSAGCASGCRASRMVCCMAAAAPTRPASGCRPPLRRPRAAAEKQRAALPLRKRGCLRSAAAPPR